MQGAKAQMAQHTVPTTCCNLPSTQSQGMQTLRATERADEAPRFQRLRVVFLRVSAHPGHDYAEPPQQAAPGSARADFCWGATLQLGQGTTNLREPGYTRDTGGQPNCHALPPQH